MIRPFFAGVVGCALATALLNHPSHAAVRCMGPLPAPSSGAARPITADDLLKLRDFGGTSTAISSSPFDLAPGGARLALEMHQANAYTDKYCTAIVVVSAKGREDPRIIDDAGEIVPANGSRYGIAELPLGVPKSILLRWSPSGEALAYTKNFSDRTEIWRYDVIGDHTQKLLVSPTDISALAWSPDGLSILYSSRPGKIHALAEIEAEGRNGYRYDSRFWPSSSDRPFVSSDIPLVDSAIDASTGEAVALPPEAADFLRPSGSWLLRSRALAKSTIEGVVAWSAVAGRRYREEPELKVQIGDRMIACEGVSCSNVQALWWARNGRTLWFQRRTGVAESVTEFYEWNPGRGAPRRLLRTTDALFGCRQAGENLVCAQETSIAPRSIVSIAMRDGGRRTVFNPNPEYASLSPGIVTRRQWSNSFGISTFADLVLPAGFKVGQRMPLVIVQYDSRGFLRGGTADEYPIQALVAQGFAVLSFNRPPWYGSTLPVKNEREYMRANNEGWADRRSNMSSLEVIIQQLDEEGVIDPNRVAITGQSDGASTATYVLANSSLFSTAILSTCCQSDTMFALGGEGLKDFYVQNGYPASRSDNQNFWREGTLESAINAKRVPILVQASSAEFRLALSTYSELRQRGWPIEMYVFPDEGHVKFQPAHRLAVYRRNVQWLDFWLNGAESANPVDASQYERWKAFRSSDN